MEVGLSLKRDQLHPVERIPCGSQAWLEGFRVWGIGSEELLMLLPFLVPI